MERCDLSAIREYFFAPLINFQNIRKKTMGQNSSQTHLRGLINCIWNLGSTDLTRLTAKFSAFVFEPPLCGSLLYKQKSINLHAIQWHGVIYNLI